jgi:hypothetical protein
LNTLEIYQSQIWVFHLYIQRASVDAFETFLLTAHHRPSKHLAGIYGTSQYDARPHYFALPPMHLPAEAQTLGFGQPAQALKLDLGIFIS